ncbi:MAG: glycosyltransferase [Rhizobiales bacterium]|nr:glycosyltransferase [Hyphomicrobiales bacterium]
MASIVFADSTKHYDGRDLERRPLGGTETSVIRCAQELARRGHQVTVFSNCDGPVEHEGVCWRPLSGTPPRTCDLYIACHQVNLLSFVRQPKRRAIWVLSPVRQLRHYKKIWRMWRYRPIPILTALYEAEVYSPLLPRWQPQIVLPHGLPDYVRGHEPLANPPPPRAIFASNPTRNLRRLVEIWARSILPRVPNATLEVYAIHNLPAGADVWKHWEGGVLPEGMSEAVKNSVNVHPSAQHRDLITAMRGSRTMLYLGHKAESFCVAAAEAQALGVPAVFAPVTVLPERVIDGVTGFVRADETEFADRAVALLTDDELWRRQHEAALQYQQGISWSEHAGRLEAALLSDMIPIDRSVLAPPPR